MKLDNDITPKMWERMPKPVRDYIQHLEMRLGETEKELVERTSSLPRRAYLRGSLTDERHEPKIGIIVDPSGPHPLPIHEMHTVRFWLPIRGNERWIDVRIKDATIELCGATSLEFQPCASNTASVRVHRW